MKRRIAMRRRRRQRGPSPPTGGVPERQPGRADRIKSLAETIVAVATVLALAYGAAALAFGSVGEMFDDDEGSASLIELRHVAVVNDPGVYRWVGEKSIQTSATTPQVDVTLRNMGSEPVLLTKARITIVDSAALSGCIYGGGGDVPVSNKYSIDLPVRPTRAERVVEHDLHDEVPPGEVDRPLLLFKAPRDVINTHLYALHIELLTDGDQVIDVGRFVLGVPDPLSRSGLFLPESDSMFQDQPSHYRLLSTWCFRHNLAAVRRVIGRDGERTPDIAALADVRAAPGWQSYVDPRSAREAIDPLLKSDFDGPWFAAFAAERTGDRQLLDDTRERAAAILRRRAEKALVEADGYSPPALEDARDAQTLSPSPDGLRLLMRAEAERREADRSRH